VDAADPEVSEEVGGLDPAMNEPTSITSFFTLPTITRQRHTKIRDPIFDFAQSKIFTCEEYTIAAEELKLTKEIAKRAKAQQCCEKQDLKIRRALEHEKGRLAREAARAEASRLKELRAAGLQARKHALRVEAQHVRAQRIADAAIAKVAEKARKAAELQEQQHLWIARVAEMAQGSQGGRTRVDTIATEPQVLPTQIPSSIPEHAPQFPPSQNHSYFFSPPTGFLPMSSSAHLFFPHLNTPMLSTQPLHPMLQYSSPFHVFQTPL
jgi:hypothetical protein